MEYDEFKKVVEKFKVETRHDHYVLTIDHAIFSYHNCMCCRRHQDGERWKIKGVNLKNRTNAYYWVCPDCMSEIMYGQVDNFLEN
jgi:hypothetical protein